MDVSSTNHKNKNPMISYPIDSHWMVDYLEKPVKDPVEWGLYSDNKWDQDYSQSYILIIIFISF
jgi:hypothetical protein